MIRHDLRPTLRLRLRVHVLDQSVARLLRRLLLTPSLAGIAPGSGSGIARVGECFGTDSEAVCCVSVLWCVVKLVQVGVGSATGAISLSSYHLFAEICAIVLTLLVVCDESVLGSGVRAETAVASWLLSLLSLLTAAGGSARCLGRKGCVLLRLFFRQLGLDLLLAAHLFNDPVVATVIFVPVTLHAALEQPAKVVVIGLFLEHDVATVLQILGEFLRLAHGHLLYSSAYFLLFYAIVLVVLVFALESLPGQVAL